MVPRYSRPEMAAIWAPENRFRIWFEIEALACEAMAELGDIPKDAARIIREKGAEKVRVITQADLDRIFRLRQCHRGQDSGQGQRDQGAAREFLLGHVVSPHS